MIWWFLLIWLLMGTGTIILHAYDAFSQQFDWGLSGGWELFWFQRYVIYFLIMVTWPYALPKELIEKIQERPYVNEWRTKGSYTRKLK